MSGLKDRLKRLTGSRGATPSEEAPAPAGPPEQAAPPAEAEAAEARTGAQGPPFEAVAAERPYRVEPLDDAWQRLDAARVVNAAGAFIRRRRVYSRAHVHGDYALAGLEAHAPALCALYEGPPAACGDLLFFDTETTGLGVGAGNVPFMIGLGFYEEGAFVAEQLFIRNPAEELAMLHYLLPLLRAKPYLVSYNGRSFDWPLLKNRFVLNRIKEGVPEPVQIDFLYPSRSLWRNTLPSCRLSKVEEARLGFNRVDDVPGSMAPTLYFLYLAEKRPSDIGPVFLHNEWDILSLAGLAVLFGEALQGSYPRQPVKGEEAFRLGLWLHRMGQAERSLAVLAPLNMPDARDGDCPEFGLALAAHYKQLGRWEEALRLWEWAIATPPQPVPLDEQTLPPPAVSVKDRLEAYVELSMYYEHRAKETALALRYAHEAYALEQDRASRMDALRQREERLGGVRGGKGKAKRPRKWEGYIPPAERAGPEPSPAAAAQLPDDVLEPPLSETAAELYKRIARLMRKHDRAASRTAAPSKAAPKPAADSDAAPPAKRRRRTASGGTDAMTLF